MPVIFSLLIMSVVGQSRITNEEYEIYGFVLTQFFRDRNRDDPDNPEKHIVIASKTKAIDPENASTERSSVHRSFNDRNRGESSIEPRFRVRFSYSIADEQEILEWAAQDEADFSADQEQRRRDGRPLHGGPCGAEWKRFYSQFPKSFGYYRLSTIGFSRDHRRAYLEIKGKGSTWDENMSYWLKWTRRGWRTEKAGGGFGQC